MKRMVLDASCMREPALEQYFLAAQNNTVVLTDMACMEAYKGNALENVRRSIQILAKYPARVAVLKPTRTIIGMQDRDPHLGTELFIDQRQTEGFAEFCQHIELASAGNSKLAAQVRTHGQEAAKHFQKMLDDAPLFAEAVAQVARSLNSKFVDALRSESAFPPGTADEVMEHIMWLAAENFRSHPDSTSIPRDPVAFRRTLIFRYSLVGFVLAVRWVGDGGAKNAAHRKLRNDIIDANYVAYATLFDGLLTNDSKMLSICEVSHILLDRIFPEL